MHTSPSTNEPSDLHDRASDVWIGEPPDAALLALVSPLCDSHGVELVELRILRGKAGAVLRVLIDRDGGDHKSGVTLDDCTDVSRDLSAALDLHEELMSGAYRLEVSSPGPLRPIARRADMARFVGETIKIRLQNNDFGARSFTAVLDACDGERCTFGEREIPISAIESAQVKVRFTL